MTKQLDIELVRDLLFKDSGWRLQGFEALSIGVHGTILVERPRLVFNQGLVGLTDRMLLHGDSLMKYGRQE